MAYLATDTEINQEVVVKLFKNTNSIENTRTVWEKDLIPATNSFDHHHILKLHGAGFDTVKDSSG